MDIHYSIQYILSWIYHNVIHTDAAFAILKIMIIIGLVSLLVYREYMLFVLLCVVILSFECFRWITVSNETFGDVLSLTGSNWLNGTSDRNTDVATITAGILDKDTLTNGVSLSNTTFHEGFSLQMPKIIKGDDSGKDHRRSNKFIEEDSNDFTDKYFKSKQCSIGSGAGSITMFGSNELLGDTRKVNIKSIYDFDKNITQNNSSGDATKRATYFIDCVYNPIKRSYNKVGSFRKANTSEYIIGDFRDMKTLMYHDINNRIIDINRCLARFNTEILFNTVSDVTADKSKPIYLSNMKSNSEVSYKSLIAGNTNTDKMKNIQPLNSGSAGDNRSDSTYSQLLQSVNSDERYKNNYALKQHHLTVYNTAYSFRKRINEILSIMRTQTKNDASLLYTIRVDEAVIQELRMMLGWFAIVERTYDIIKFETELGTGDITKGIYATILDTTPPPSTISAIAVEPPEKITGDLNIFRIPHDDDTYNSIDEKRYLYGITYYFGGRPHETPTS
jgi:hypothetical protein